MYLIFIVNCISFRPTTIDYFIVIINHTQFKAIKKHIQLKLKCIKCNSQKYDINVTNQGFTYLYYIKCDILIIRYDQ